MIGTYGVLTISAVLYIIALIYGIFYLKEPSYEIEIKTEGAKRGFLVDFFDTKNIVECFKVVLKKGPNHRCLR